MTHAAQFESVVATKLPALRNLARRYVQNPHDAEDVVQEALLRAHCKLHTFRGSSALSTWLAKIVINCSHMHNRGMAGRFRLAPESESLFLEALADSSKNPEESLVDRTQRAQLEAHIKTLPPCIRETWALRMLDLSMEEIRSVLGVPIGTVKARLARGRAILARKANAQCRA